MNTYIYIARHTNPWRPLLRLLPHLSTVIPEPCTYSQSLLDSRQPHPLFPQTRRDHIPHTRGDELTKAQSRANKLQPLGCLVTRATGIKRNIGDLGTYRQISTCMLPALGRKKPSLVSLFLFVILHAYAEGRSTKIMMATLDSPRQTPCFTPSSLPPPPNPSKKQDRVWREEFNEFCRGF